MGIRFPFQCLIKGVFWNYNKGISSPINTNGTQGRLLGIRKEPRITLESQGIIE
jgi:hypothetical protein